MITVDQARLLPAGAIDHPVEGEEVSDEELSHDSKLLQTQPGVLATARDALISPGRTFFTMFRPDSGTTRNATVCVTDPLF